MKETQATSHGIKAPSPLAFVIWLVATIVLLGGAIGFFVPVCHWGKTGISIHNGNNYDETGGINYYMQVAIYFLISCVICLIAGSISIFITKKQHSKLKRQRVAYESEVREQAAAENALKEQYVSKLEELQRQIDALKGGAPTGEAEEPCALRTADAPVTVSAQVSSAPQDTQGDSSDTQGEDQDGAAPNGASVSPDQVSAEKAPKPQNKYLLLARRAREEGSAEDAKKYYGIILTEDPENVEAKFFYSYYRILAGRKGEAYKNFIAYGNGINSTLSMILASNDSDADKKAFIKDILRCTENAGKVVSSANRDIGGIDGRLIVLSYWEMMHTIFFEVEKIYRHDADLLIAKYRFRKDRIRFSEGNRLLEKYELGDEIERLYSSIPAVLEFAIELWKECIDIQQREYNTANARQCKGFAEKYAEKIKKYEPTYVMPKKAGCITIKKI